MASKWPPRISPWPPRLLEPGGPQPQRAGRDPESRDRVGIQSQPPRADRPGQEFDSLLELQWLPEAGAVRSCRVQHLKKTSGFPRPERKPSLSLRALGHTGGTDPDPGVVPSRASFGAPGPCLADRQGTCLQVRLDCLKSLGANPGKAKNPPAFKRKGLLQRKRRKGRRSLPTQRRSIRSCLPHPEDALLVSQRRLWCRGSGRP